MTEKTQKRASVYTLGCRLNQSETAIIEEKLRGAGYTLVPFGEPADLGVINTCTVTAEADAKGRKAIRGFNRKNPNAYTAVIGCYSQTDSEALAKIKGVDLIVGTQRKLDFLDYVSTKKNATPVIVQNGIGAADFTIEISHESAFTRRANLKIQDGCDFNCSFCIVPRARGPARSRDMDNLLQEARSLVRCGAKEIVLTGVNIGTYRWQGQNLVDVVNRLNEIAGLERIRISSTEPSTVAEDLFPLMVDPAHALAPFLHIPLQSGSDKRLRLMHRRYTALEFADFLGRASCAVADLCIGTDVMVGFPGEGDAEFEETRRLLADNPITYAHVFKFSERGGTPAAKLADRVDAKTQNARSAIIRRISARKRRRFYEAHLGRRMRVLFEEQEGGLWFGYTGNYIRVGAPSDENVHNEIRTTRLERLRSDIVLAHIEKDRPTG
ncbi:MAG TPA: tRNA (N(6)-L-threonylcarbamoyladenosine(37)-C(2))-methylthiotransferase MtaB [Candidatus Hydrogenedentes bacterium]|nr:tRNA (N(6)-L-threonylcarbamoyladenosine(37)-C(2))-methylthiotransferase MtaB [Candidatus Hydrogenedentota bacterium]